MNTIFAAFYRLENMGSFLISWFLLGLSYYVFRFYSKVRSMPPGPLPVPFLGSISVLLMKGNNYIKKCSVLSKQYGDISTVWIGTAPVIFINDFDLAKRIFNDKSMDFNGRGDDVVTKVILNGRQECLNFCDTSPKQTQLRKLAHRAIRTFTAEERLPKLVAEVVDHFLSLTDLNSEIDTKALFYDINLKIVSTLNLRDSNDMSEHSTILSLFETIGKAMPQLAIAYYVPILMAFKYKAYIECKNCFIQMRKIVAKSFKQHLEEYEDNKINNFCDALINQRNVMLKEGKISENELTDEDLSIVVYDLFLAGMDSNRQTMRWVFLFLSYYPEMQLRIRNEIKDKIGNRSPLLDDKNECDFTNAFISEVIRFRNVFPIGLPHKAMRDTRIDNYDIPKGSMIVSFTDQYMFDEKYWRNPNEFNPNRFLKEGKLDMQSFPHFQPFGVGKRSCIGDRFSTSLQFLMLARILQKTPNRLFCLTKEPEPIDLEPNPTLTLTSNRRYNLVLKKHNL